MTSSMYNSIQQFNEGGVKKIEKVVKKFICEKEDFADLVLGLKESLFELGRDLLKEIIEDMSVTSVTLSYSLKSYNEDISIYKWREFL